MGAAAAAAWPVWAACPDAGLKDDPRAACAGGMAPDPAAECAAACSPVVAGEPYISAAPARAAAAWSRGGGAGCSLGVAATQLPMSSCPGFAALRFLAAGCAPAAGGPSPGWGGVGWCIAVQPRLASGAGSGRLGPRVAAGRPRGRRTAPEQRARAGAGPRAASQRRLVLAKPSTGEKNEKKRAGRMSRTRAKSILSGSGSILGGSKLGLGCVLPPKNVGCPRKKTRFLNERWLGCAWPTPKWGPKPSRDSSFFARLRENTVAPGHPQINKKHENQEPSCHRNPELREKTWFACTLVRF